MKASKNYDILQSPDHSMIAFISSLGHVILNLVGKIFKGINRSGSIC